MVEVKIFVSKIKADSQQRVDYIRPYMGGKFFASFIAHKMPLVVVCWTCPLERNAYIPGFAPKRKGLWLLNNQFKVSSHGIHQVDAPA